MKATSDDHQTTFLASVFDPPTDDYFQGYCFFGYDLIFGTQGALKYSSQTGKTIPGGLDGRYVKISRQNNAYVFDTDFAGYEVLYYYHDGSTWVVSNSFSQVVDYLRLHGITITPNYTHLSLMTHRRMPAQQLFSFETIAREIRVAPPAFSMIVLPNRIVLKRRAKSDGEIKNYTQALTAHLDLWIGRFQTLMLDKTADFTTELTGGVDSRANLVLLVAAKKRLGKEGKQPRIVSNTGSRYEADLNIALSLAKYYGFKLNDKREIKTYELSGSERFQTFRDLSLGVYYPLYFPVKGPSPTDISISGGGGGIHRRIYETMHKTDDINRLIQTYADKAGHPEYRFEFIRDANRMLDLIIEPGDDPLRVLLRDGRVRYHTGRAARFATSFAPLHSTSASRAQLNAGEDRLEQGQFNYDIMYSIDPDLVDMSYDVSSKSPNDSVRRNLVAAPIHNGAAPGKVWMGSLALKRSLAPKNSNLYSEVQDALDRACDNPFVTTFWSKNLVKDAQALAATLNSGESIGNAINGLPIHALLAADLVTPS